MLKVTIDLIPFGFLEKETLGTIEIANIDGDKKYGDYALKLKREGCDNLEGLIKCFEREDGAFELCKQAIQFFVDIINVNKHKKNLLGEERKE